jgi:hypothetical protein
MRNRLGSIAALVAFALSGCSGGESISDVLRIESLQPASIDAEIWVGDAAPDVRLVGRVSGDLSFLNGKTLYIVIEDPAQLFTQPPVLSLNPEDKSAEILLLGRLQNAPGTLQGQIRVFACLDLQCKSQLGGSPAAIPYHVVVHPGLVVADTPRSLTGLFGSTPESIDIPMTLPGGTTGPPVIRELLVENHVSGDAFGGPRAASTNVFQATVSTPAAGQTTLHVAAAPALVGTYKTMFELSVPGPRTPSGGVRQFRAFVTVSYTVSPNPSVLIFVVPANPIVEIPFGNPFGHHLSVVVMAQSGTLGFFGVDYSRSVPPPGGDPDAPYKSWLGTNEFFAFSCVGIGAVNHCMVPGDYVAELKLTNADNGVSKDYLVPVTLRVTQ